MESLVQMGTEMAEVMPYMMMLLELSKRESLRVLDERMATFSWMAFRAMVLEMLTMSSGCPCME